MIEDRKLEHIKICAEKDVYATHNYWDDVIIKHHTIPKVDYDDIDLSVEFLGRKLDYPIIVDAMTGGHRIAKKINENIAKACEQLGIGMAVGSQRSAIENPHLEDTYSVISDYEIPLRIGNLGAPQIALGYGEEEIKKAIEMINAHALQIHFNYLQEAIQPEGDRIVRGLLDKLEKIAKNYSLIAKETGAGFDKSSAKLLVDIGFKAIDVSGVSGTSFAAVEFYRGGKYGRTFWDWGLPSPYALLQLKDLNVPLIGSGGIRNGLDAAKAIVMGADVVGITRTILRPAMRSSQEVVEKLQDIINELKIAVFLSGASNIQELKNAEYIITGKLRDWL